ncbi:DUF4279 domain-containing protein [Caldibacillus lycopersici]|uniref:DUF4279 domain-containing protein n=1 Tax=Perspicuibacillus lycopersici TaxID=1325689 RepID=A0AAE3IRN5_9BACI|nr:DUF4279 domain-containing protein [Perspicuibacillus lycopersici]MCU9613358.1 DUF4279 domain-containing protein [Perspicuibacillus lycopersici]
MSNLIFIAFTIHTYIDDDGTGNHFDPQTITKNLQVIPFSSQSYNPDGYPRSGIIDNPYCSSWIYRNGGYYESSYNEVSEMFVLDELFIQLKTSLFTPEKKFFLKEIIEAYDAHCYLDVYTFNVGDYINNVTIPADLIAAITNINADISIHTHSKDLLHYKAHQHRNLFKF